MNKFVLVKVFGTLISSVAQIFLKKSAGKVYKNKIFEYLNPYVLGAYGVYFVTVFLSVYALKGISMSFSAIIESLGFILIPIFSYLVLKEKISRSQILGIALIMLGIIVYNL